ncbi:MAG: hypothetical protein D3905_13025 [Candidatus Electrothrix sp. AS4_5]|nr:hypothetical protein [Candidatus Electrothrix gigas]
MFDLLTKQCSVWQVAGGRVLSAQLLIVISWQVASSGLRLRSGCHGRHLQCRGQLRRVPV